jgi:hypothetical protein
MKFTTWAANRDVSFEVSTTVNIQIAVFWVQSSCNILDVSQDCSVGTDTRLRSEWPRVGIRLQARATDFLFYGVHPASHTVGTGTCFPGYTECFKISFTTLNEYTNLYREHTQGFELS